MQSKKYDKSQYSSKQSKRDNYFKAANKNLQKESTKKYPEKGAFSNSRYDGADEDEEEYMPYYAQQENNHEGDQINTDENYEEDDANERLYQNAKNSITRTKILLMSSQKDMQMYNQMEFNDDEDEEDAKMDDNKRVKRILKNKEKRKIVKETDLSEHAKKFLKDANLNSSSSSDVLQPSSTVQKSSENNRTGSFLPSDPSRNNFNPHSNVSNTEFSSSRYSPSKNPHNLPTPLYIHQTTSSGNLVLYDSANNTSLQSPHTTFDPLPSKGNKIVKEQNWSKGKMQRIKSTESDDLYDEVDILQNDERITGKIRINNKELDEGYPHYYEIQDDEEVDDDDYDEGSPGDVDESEDYGQIKMYVKQITGNKFGY